MRKFWDLLKESVIIQGLITLAVIGTICYLVIAGQEVPSELWSWGALILGFFFGSKIAVASK